EDDVPITGARLTDDYIVYENVDPSKVYMLINAEGDHWVTGAVNLLNFRFYVFDSLHSEGTNLVAVGMDENNQIVSVAFGICKRHPAIALAIHNEFPLAFHVVCCHPLMMNLSLKKKKTKGLYWKICKAYILEEFTSNMNILQDVQPDAYDKLCQDGPQRCEKKATGHNVGRNVSYNDLSTVLILNDGSLEQSFASIISEETKIKQQESLRLTVLMALQEAHDEESYLEEQMLSLIHRFTDRFTRRRREIDRLKSLPDHPLIYYARYALKRMTGADMRNASYLKMVRDELLRSMEEKREFIKNYKEM
nr:transposase, MuDR, MULE transposase domain protein [Tanacetum cinerariifolium]